MKKSTIRITVVFLILIVGVVGYYSYLSQKSRNASAEAAQSKIQMLLSRDLGKEYPPTPKEVVKYFTELQKCMYNEECTAEEMKQLGIKSRELFDAELQDNNPLDDYIPLLKTDIETFHEEKKQILSISLPASVSVDHFSEDGFEFARLYCKYSVMEKGKSSQVQIVYLLRKDDSGQWRIYGWDRADAADKEVIAE